MGLDMYLRGDKYFWTSWDNPKQDRSEDGFKVEAVHLRLGQWRKHANLHGYIVNTFAEGKDECQEIDLTVDNMRNIIAALKARTLPHTEGFFFGSSYGGMGEAEIAADIEKDCKVFEAAIAWLEAGAPASDVKGQQQVSRDVTYQASW